MEWSGTYLHHQGRDDGVEVGVMVGVTVGVGVGVPASTVGVGEARGVGVGVDKLSTQPTAAQAFILP